MEQKRKLRVMIVEPNPLTRLGMASLIHVHPLLEPCAEASDAPTARRLCAESKPDIIVMSVTVPLGDGVELVREFHRLHSHVRVLVVSDREDLVTLKRVFRAGAQGCVHFEEETAELLAGLEHLVVGRRFSSRRVNDLLLAYLSHGEPNHSPDREVSTLSDREFQVFLLLGKELLRSAMAQELGLSVKTIETHVQRIKRKFDVRTTADLRKRAEAWLRFHKKSFSRKTTGAVTDR